MVDQVARVSATPYYFLTNHSESCCHWSFVICHSSFILCQFSAPASLEGRV
ncbi:hypothetical protein [Coleofasciculus sp. F4-SAH-05]|uniref:hypothetical protein n=1 Tax=Coleofasciculus sp. F4-SAH-05 TaxID=3069525 RepID=UPI0032F6E953